MATMAKYFSIFSSRILDKTDEISNVSSVSSDEEINTTEKTTDTADIVFHSDSAASSSTCGVSQQLPTSKSNVYCFL